LVKVKLFSPLLCVCALPGKAIHEMTYTASGGMWTPTHLLTHSYGSCICNFCLFG